MSVARNFDGVFWPKTVIYFGGRIGLNDPTETEPLLTAKNDTEAVAATFGAKVANDVFRAMVRCEFRESVLRWR